MTVVIKKVGGSLAVVIPKALASAMGLTEGTSLEIAGSDDAIVMRRPGRRPRRALGSIVHQIVPASYKRRNRELLRDLPVGKEVW